MAKKKTPKQPNKVKSKSKKKAAAPPDSHDKLLRDHLVYLLTGGGAHIGFADEFGNWTAQLAGVKVANFPHTGWMLLEHMRLAQWDILEFSRNPKYVAQKWPDDYWPASEAPADEKAWTASLAGFKKDLQALELLVSQKKADLYAKIPWGDGQTILRELLLVADHNSYHLGQLVMVRKSIAS